MGFFRQEHWCGLPFPTPGDLPNPGIESASLMSPALAGEFFTTWEAYIYDIYDMYVIYHIYTYVIFLIFPVLLLRLTPVAFSTALLFGVVSQRQARVSGASLPPLSCPQQMSRESKPSALQETEQTPRYHHTQGSQQHQAEASWDLTGIHSST